MWSKVVRKIQRSLEIIWDWGPHLSTFLIWKDKDWWSLVQVPVLYLRASAWVSNTCILCKVWHVAEQKFEVFYPISWKLFSSMVVKTCYFQNLLHIWLFAFVLAEGTLCQRKNQELAHLSDNIIFIFVDMETISWWELVAQKYQTLQTKHIIPC